MDGAEIRRGDGIMKVKIILEISESCVESIKEAASITTAEELKGFFKMIWLAYAKNVNSDDAKLTVEVEE